MTKTAATRSEEKSQSDGSDGSRRRLSSVVGIEGACVLYSTSCHLQDSREQRRRPNQQEAAVSAEAVVGLIMRLGGSDWISGVIRDSFLAS